jgi:hypothetical protein
MPKQAEPAGHPVKSHIAFEHMPPGVLRQTWCAQLADVVHAWPMSLAGAASPGQRCPGSGRHTLKVRALWLNRWRVTQA